jgi:hypothetical protein
MILALILAAAINAIPPAWVGDTTVRGLYTPYDASTMHCVGKRCEQADYGSWWTMTAAPSSRWVSVSQQRCKAHPAWGCYRKDMGGWRKWVRPYSANLTLYAAAGPLLKKAIRRAYGGQIPSIWHREPFIRVRFSVRLASGRLISQVAYVVDMCICKGSHKDPNDDRIVDMSRDLWAIFYPARAEGNRRITAEVIAP